MKKQINWTTVLFFVILITGGIILGSGVSAVLQARFEIAVQKAVKEQSLNTVNADNVGDAEKALRNEFISVEDLTDGMLCDRSGPIELKVGHEYRVVYSLPEKNAGFDWEDATFRVRWCPIYVDAGGKAPLKATLRAGSINVSDTVTFSASEVPLWLSSINPDYQIYKEEENGRIGSLVPSKVAGVAGASLSAELGTDEDPRYITWGFRVEEREEDPSDTVNESERSESCEPLKNPE